jgi:hypothetical protein
MHQFDLVTEADLVRAREDSAFRRKLLTANLERLLSELNKLRRSIHDVTRAGQIQEGVELAVKLAELLRSITPDESHLA